MRGTAPEQTPHRRRVVNSVREDIGYEPVCTHLPLRVPECNLPIAISRIRPEKNLETIESEKFDIRCEYCNESSTALANVARAHWITAWA